MKQRITIGQINKLPDAHKEQLREWWWGSNPTQFDVYTLRFKYDDITRYEGTYSLNSGRDFHTDYHKGEALPILSIGQMIQFIQEKKPSLKGITKARFDKWFVNLDTAQLGYKDELCDSLWEATMQILKGEQGK